MGCGASTAAPPATAEEQKAATKMQAIQRGNTARKEVGVKELVQKFQDGFFDGTGADHCTDDALFNPPGAPPMPIKDLLGMVSGCKTAFPGWTSKCLGVEANADGTYTVLTQQCMGPMKADLPAMGPFPAVAVADVPELCKSSALNFPVEVGTYTLSKDGSKIANGAYAGATREVKGTEVTAEISAMWNKKGDLSDVGFGCLFTLLGVSLAPPPPSAEEQNAATKLQAIQRGNTARKEVAPSWTPEEGAVFHRVTKVPIKPGTIGQILEVAQKDEFSEHIKTFEGFLGVETMAVGEELMVTHSRWESKAACDGGAAALGGVLKGFLSEFIAGPPEPPMVGPRTWKYSNAEGEVKAYRMMVIPLKGLNVVAEANGVGKSKEAQFKEIEGLLSITTFVDVEQTKLITCAGYTSMEALEAASPKIKEVMADMMPFFGGPPEPLMGELSWTSPGATL